jgi:hypothetical protein
MDGPRHAVTFARSLYDKNTPNTAIGGKPQAPAGGEIYTIQSIRCPPWTDEEIMASRGNICFAAECLRCGVASEIRRDQRANDLLSRLVVHRVGRTGARR